MPHLFCLYLPFIYLDRSHHCSLCIALCAFPSSSIVRASTLNQACHLSHFMPCSSLSVMLILPTLHLQTNPQYLLSNFPLLHVYLLLSLFALILSFLIPPFPISELFPFVSIYFLLGLFIPLVLAPLFSQTHPSQILPFLSSLISLTICSLIPSVSKCTLIDLNPS